MAVSEPIKWRPWQEVLRCPLSRTCQVSICVAGVEGGTEHPLGKDELIRLFTTLEFLYEVVQEPLAAGKERE